MMPHRQSSWLLYTMYDAASKVCEGMSTFLSKAIPDCKDTQKHLEESRYTYLAHSLRLQTMLDKEETAKV